MSLDGTQRWSHEWQEGPRNNRGGTRTYCRGYQVGNRSLSTKTRAKPGDAADSGLVHDRDNDFMGVPVSLQDPLS